MQCPKCSDPMTGPYFKEPANELEYVCKCGFRKREPAHDARGISPEAEAFKELLRKAETARPPGFRIGRWW